MDAPITFLHLTDLHISDPATPDPHLACDTLAVLDRVIDTIAGLTRRPDFVLISGDLTNRGDAASYRLLADRLQAIAAPVLLALGNHDARGPFRAEMLGAPGEAAYVHDRLIGGAHVIVLDSLVPGRIGGALDAAQFDFLGAALNRHPDVPKLVMLHHPPALEPDAEMVWHSLNWEDSDRLGAMLEGRVAGLFCGHVHVPRVSHWRGLPVVTGNGLYNTADPLIDEGMRVVEATGFGLCRLRPSGLSVDFVSLPHSGRELDRMPQAALLSWR